MKEFGAHTMQMAQKYWLAQHVHLCKVSGGVVLLDLRKDKYLGLGGTHLYALSEAVHGWPAYPERPAEIASEEIFATAEKLVAAGVLTREASQGKTATPVVLDQIEMSGIEQPAHPPRIRMSHVANFLSAWIHAAAALRWQSLDLIVSRVNARKQLAMRGGIQTDSKKTAELALIFGRLRSLLYTRNNRCLFDSLTFIHFLARYRQFPLWVLGVQSHPFSAHSWVQQDGIVLDDSPGRVYDYTPILTI